MRDQLKFWLWVFVYIVLGVLTATVVFEFPENLANEIREMTATASAWVLCVVGAMNIASKLIGDE